MKTDIISYVLAALPAIALILAFVGYRQDSQRLKLLALPLALIGLAWWINLGVRMALANS